VPAVGEGEPLGEIAADRRLLFPPDLRERVTPDALLTLSIEAVVSLDLPGRGLRTWRGGEDTFAAPMLCTLLVFAYATCRFNSEELDDQVAVDPQLQYLCGRQRPSAHTLQRFRRAHRSFIGLALMDVLRRLVTNPGQFTTDALASAVGFAAEERLHLAVLADSVARDC